MNAKILLLLLSLSLSVHGYSQVVLSGAVYDDETGEPVPGVAVYLDGTTYGTGTDIEGRFSLSLPIEIKTQLICSHISYKIMAVPEPFSKDLDNIRLAIKEVDIEDIVVGGDPFTHTAKLKAFREEFLGRTIAGKSCVIENEGDITLYYNPANKRLSASCNKEIVVRNDFFGYKIYFTLDSFYSEYDRVTLNAVNQREFHFSGGARFEEFAHKDSKRFERRREKSYHVSSRALFRRLTSGTLSLSRFMVYAGFEDMKHWMTNPGDYFRFSGDRYQMQITIRPDTYMTDMREWVKQNPDRTVAPYGMMHVKNIDSKDSSILFFLNAFNVDAYGNVSEGDRVHYNGYMAERRLGDMLPIEYEPANATGDVRGVFIF